MEYERCPRAFKYHAIDHLPQLPRDIATDPMARGSRVHEGLDETVRLGANVPREATGFKELLDHARLLFEHGMVTTEENWFFDEDWKPCSRDKVWLWAKLDLDVSDKDKNTCYVVDYKTGKSKYKIIEHVQQGQLYAACVAQLRPWVQSIIVEFWYIDENMIKTFEYTREQALEYIGRFQRRVDRLYAEKYFPPRPSRMNCKWCAYGRDNGTGVCPASA
jgi:CRISPR/Cas system-associated exonuclease Cas4 (RecB family)